MTDESTIMSGLTFAQMEGSCYCCGKRGHLSSRFPEKSKPKSERAATKMKGVVHAQQILNQAAADIKKVGCAQPSQPILTKLIMMEYSPRLIFRKQTGWLKEQKMT